MAITFTRAYVSTSGKTYASLKEAQAAELKLLVEDRPPDQELSDYLIEVKDELIDILMTT